MHVCSRYQLDLGVECAETKYHVCCRFEVKHVSGMGGRSPPRGGAAVGAANQLFLTGSDEEADDDREAGTNAEPQADQKASRKCKVPCTLDKRHCFLTA